MMYYIKILLNIILVYLVLGIVLYLFQNYFIYLPLNSNNISPQYWGLSNDVKLISLTTEDDLILSAWYRKANLSKPTLVYFHGNAGHIGLRAPVIKPYISDGYGLLLLTYRGYSNNPGQPTEQGIYKDARAALNYLLDNKVNSDCIMLMGVSLGTGVAVQMATEYDISALILISSFTSLVDVGAYHYFYYPVRYIIDDSYNNLSKISQFKTQNLPVLFIHSVNDKIIPYKFGSKLYDSFIMPKKLISLESEGHNNLYGISDYVLPFITDYNKCNIKDIKKLE